MLSLRVLWALVLALLVPVSLHAQAQLINGHVVVTGTENACTSATGTDSYACALLRLPTTPSYNTGTCYQFTADVANLGPASINFSSMGVRTITKVQGGITTPLVDNDIRIGHIVKVCYDGTNMQCQNCNGNAPTGSGGVTTGTAGRPAYYPARVPR